MARTGVYFHWPFCLSKCAYCDFYSVPKQCVDLESTLKLYKNVTVNFFENYKGGSVVDSIYFGGGTPSLLPAWFIKELIELVKSFSSGVSEVTLESNPNTISCESAESFRDAGVNRLSIGVQSFNNENLKLLGRSHNSKVAISAIKNIGDVFDNISIDLMYSLPFQTIDSWQDDLKTAFDLGINHISAYQLIVEDGTKMGELVNSGAYIIPENDEEFYDTTINLMNAHGFNQYEVSNFSKTDDYKCKHNVGYWRYDDYFGIGPSAHSRVSKDGNKIAIEQVSDFNKWTVWAQTFERFSEEKLSDEDILKEVLIMGLRHSEGIDLNLIQKTLPNNSNFFEKINKLKRNLCIIMDDGYIKATSFGLKKLNLVVEYLVGKL